MILIVSLCYCQSKVVKSIAVVPTFNYLSVYPCNMQLDFFEHCIMILMWMFHFTKQLLGIMRYSTPWKLFITLNSNRIKYFKQFKRFALEQNKTFKNSGKTTIKICVQRLCSLVRSIIPWGPSEVLDHRIL